MREDNRFAKLHGNFSSIEVIGRSGPSQTWIPQKEPLFRKELTDSKSYLTSCLKCFGRLLGTVHCAAADRVFVLAPVVASMVIAGNKRLDWFGMGESEGIFAAMMCSFLANAPLSLDFKVRDNVKDMVKAKNKIDGYWNTSKKTYCSLVFFYLVGIVATLGGAVAQGILTAENIDKEKNPGWYWTAFTLGFFGFLLTRMSAVARIINDGPTIIRELLMMAGQMQDVPRAVRLLNTLLMTLFMLISPFVWLRMYTMKMVRGFDLVHIWRCPPTGCKDVSRANYILAAFLSFINVFYFLFPARNTIPLSYKLLLHTKGKLTKTSCSAGTASVFAFFIVAAVLSFIGMYAYGSVGGLVKSYHAEQLDNGGGWHSVAIGPQTVMLGLVTLFFGLVNGTPSVRKLEAIMAPVTEDKTAIQLLPFTERSSTPTPTPGESEPRQSRSIFSMLSFSSLCDFWRRKGESGSQVNGVNHATDIAYIPLASI